jgi:hypothetical protein
MKFMHFCPLAVAVILSAGSLFAEEPAAPKRPDDVPSVKIGGVLFTDFTQQRKPAITDSDGNKVELSTFNIGRAYLNVTGNVNHLLAYRVTPEVTRESGSGSSLTGSYTFRLKFAYGQINLDDWATKGSWIRVGLNQTPYVDYTETIYRYRLQGPIFADREGYLIPSDLGVSGHYNFPHEYGDVQAGVYNGEGFAKSEVNDQKALQARVSLRPFAASKGVARGLRLTAFAVADHYVQNAERNRFLGQVSWEGARANAAFEYLTATDQTSVTKPEVEARGWSAWVTPKFGHGWEALLRHDSLEPNRDTEQHKTRTIAGVAKWFVIEKISTGVMLDTERVSYSDFVPERNDETRFSLHLALIF